MIFFQEPYTVRIYIYRSAMMLKLLTGDMDTIDYLVTTTPVNGGIYYAASKQSVSWSWHAGSRKIGQAHKNLSNFNKCEIKIARQLAPSTSNTAGLARCSRYAAVNTYRKWPEKGQPVNRRQCNGHPRLITAVGEWRLACLVWFHRRGHVAQISEKGIAG